MGATVTKCVELLSLLNEYNWQLLNGWLKLSNVSTQRRKLIFLEYMLYHKIFYTTNHNCLKNIWKYSQTMLLFMLTLNG